MGGRDESELADSTSELVPPCLLDEDDDDDDERDREDKREDGSWMMCSREVVIVVSLSVRLIESKVDTQLCPDVFCPHLLAYNNEGVGGREVSTICPLTTK